MLRRVEETETLLAWVEAPDVRELDANGEQGPELRLRVIAEHEDVLVAELADGEPCRKGSILWVEDRGSFEVVGVVAREGVDDRRTYLQLRIWRFPAVA